MAWGSRVRCLTRCGCGINIARRCRCPPNRSAHAGERALMHAKAQTQKAPPENSSRERILQRIRTGLRTVVAEPAAMKSERLIFAPIENPLGRFRQECIAN